MLTCQEIGDKVRDKNIWVCKSKSRMMFYAGSSWVITSTQYMQDILGGGTGGFASSNKGWFTLATESEA